MSAHPQILRPITRCVVVEPGMQFPEFSQLLRVFDERGVHEVRYWGDLPRSLPGRVLKAVAYMIPVADAAEGATHLTVARFEWDHDMPAFRAVPPDFGTANEDVHRARDLMESVNHPLVRQLLSDVFSEPGAFFEYWSAPIRPLAEAGSLVRNAVVLGEHFRDRPFLPRDQRDLGIAYAILRDIGNVWFHASADPADDPAQALRMALEKLDGPLAHFDATCPEYAAILRELLFAPLTPATNPRAQVLLGYASEVPEHHGPLDEVDVLP